MSFNINEEDTDFLSDGSDVETEDDFVDIDYDGTDTEEDTDFSLEDLDDTDFDETHTSSDSFSDSSEEESSSLDVSGEEESSVISPHFTIVPKSVSKARVVGLRLNGEIVAYRFKTDKGSYDMYANVAARYGLAGLKTETYITVEYKNGYMISKRELETHQLVPDISNNPEDCKTLIDAFIKYVTS